MRNKYSLTRIFSQLEVKFQSLGSRPKKRRSTPFSSLTRSSFELFHHHSCVVSQCFSDLADEEGLEGAGGVVPPEALAVPVPELEAVLLLPVLVLEVVRLPGVPVLVRHRLPRRHPEESER